MRKTSVSVYSINELEKEVRESLIEERRETAELETDWYQDVLSYHKEKLEAIGYEFCTIKFNGFGSQGDGASFTCESIDIKKWIQKSENKPEIEESLKQNILEGFIEINCSIERINNRYFHERSVRLEFELLDSMLTPSAFTNQIHEIEGSIRAEILSTSLLIYRELDAKFEEITSDKNILEELILEEYLLDGTLWNADFEN
jgi:hypothetical protein